MKLWLKSNPEITCQTLRDEPVNGYIPALVSIPHEDPSTTYAIITPEEWADREIVPAPPSVPETGYLVLFGPDPAIVRYLFVEQEIDAAIAINTRDDAFGYVPISLLRSAMVEPSKPLPDTVAM